MSKLGEEIAKVLFRKRRGFRFTQADLGTRIGVSGSCLLYTSPSPRDRTRSRMPSSA